MKRPLILNDVNFAELYRNHIQLASRAPKTAQQWDQKAEKMLTGNYDQQDQYVHEFLRRMTLHPDDSVLDVGCGGGAIALALAPQVKQVYALDFSEKMLQVLHSRTQQQGINNVQPLLKSWYDNWDEVPQCDICVSSRSSMVEDLADALDKLNAKAKRAVYMTMTVEKEFIQRDVLRAIGRDSVGFPSYIYAVNLLHQQGYHAKVDFIQSNSSMSPPAISDEHAFIAAVQWSIGQLTADETALLQDYFHTQQHKLSPRSNKRQWAFLSWEK